MCVCVRSSRLQLKKPQSEGQRQPGAHFPDLKNLTWHGNTDSVASKSVSLSRCRCLSTIICKHLTERIPSSSPGPSSLLLTLRLIVCVFVLVFVGLCLAHLFDDGLLVCRRFFVSSLSAAHLLATQFMYMPEYVYVLSDLPRIVPASSLPHTLKPKP